MTGMKCGILPYAAADGPANMAWDEALLDAAANGGEAAYLRCYGWTVPTLSLGYFQRLAEIRADPRWQTVPIVRRLTGGGAIWHHHEVTYALAVPASHEQTRLNTALYRAVHEAIAAVLAEEGVTARRRGDGTPASWARRNRPALCFTDRDAEDIVIHGYKLVGSAQRRTMVRSSSRVLYSWHAPIESLSSEVSAMWRTFPARRNTGLTSSRCGFPGPWTWTLRPAPCRLRSAAGHPNGSRPGIATRPGPHPDSLDSAPKADYPDWGPRILDAEGSAPRPQEIRHSALM
jgi:lipoate-protein ligase A